ncbi:hypothetical protein [Agromyces larvae]|uniref:Tetratricopeptide repeat protein n=1 Tax=Agromyces larvae TaxID=2929802 RepID=A0ABY4C250_9MICO|nr:hypothetical protein [Agromyces larvae]UOE45561.1 hypothetical protein MTO99_07340 [Agromyces larvae]
MPQIITSDDVYDLEFTRLDKRNRDEQLRSRVGTLIEWATDREKYELGDRVTRAYLLLVAAEHLFDIGDHDEAWNLAEAASGQADAELFEAHPLMIEMKLESGERDAAIELADEIRTARLGDWVLTERIAEAFEHHDELALAERWFTIGATQAQQGDADDLHRARLLSGRLRVREDADKPEDVLDAETRVLRDALGWGELE